MTIDPTKVYDTIDPRQHLSVYKGGDTVQILCEKKQIFLDEDGVKALILLLQGSLAYFD